MIASKTRSVSASISTSRRRLRSRIGVICGANTVSVACHAFEEHPSVGTVGDALDNALMESTIGLFKTEVIRRDGPWRTLDDVELATLTWVDWYNNRRLHGSIGDLPPTEYETIHYRSLQTAPAA